MSLGWHSPRSGSGTDPALLDALSLIASNLAGLTQAVKELGTVTPPEPPVTDCLVKAEDGSVVVDEAGNEIVYDCAEAPVVDCLILTEQGDTIVAEDGSLITFYCAPTEECLAVAEDGSTIVNEAGAPISVACAPTVLANQGATVVSEQGDTVVGEAYG